uniref:Uncharacterized protein n=1 Tax=Cannabis sativa TaxID=3483 RepID=A0A803Q036_CANSA
MVVVIESSIWEPNPSLTLLFLAHVVSIALFPYASKNFSSSSRTPVVFNHGVVFLFISSFLEELYSPLLSCFRSVHTSLTSRIDPSFKKLGVVQHVVVEGLWSVFGEMELAYYGVNGEHIVLSLWVGTGVSIFFGILGVVSDLILYDWHPTPIGCSNGVIYWPFGGSCFQGIAAFDTSTTQCCSVVMPPEFDTTLWRNAAFGVRLGVVQGHLRLLQLFLDEEAAGGLHVLRAWDLVQSYSSPSPWIMVKDVRLKWGAYENMALFPIAFHPQDEDVIFLKRVLINDKDYNALAATDNFENDNNNVDICLYRFGRRCYEHVCYCPFAENTRSPRVLPLLVHGWPTRMPPLDTKHPPPAQEIATDIAKNKNWRSVVLQSETETVLKSKNFISRIALEEAHNKMYQSTKASHQEESLKIAKQLKNSPHTYTPIKWTKPTE